MKIEGKRFIAMSGVVCILGFMAAGCGAGAGQTERFGNAGTDAVSDETVPAGELNDEPLKETGGNTEEQQENTAGKWHVLDSDVAAVVDADFLGKVWKIGEDSFYIAEKKVKVLDDGSLSYSSPSSKATLTDSQLIHVVFEENTRFYVETADGNGESHEDKEAGFQDLKVYMSVAMKGSFINDEFYATEIRFF